MSSKKPLYSISYYKKTALAQAKAVFKF